MLVHRSALQRGKYIDQDRKRHRSCPSVSCVRAGLAISVTSTGTSIVHGGQTPCRRRLWIDERGTSGDFAEVYVRCECGQERSMAQAAIIHNRALGHCDGARPWLGPYTNEACGEPSRLLIRTASNAYFPQVMSVISLPDRDEPSRRRSMPVWEFLAEVEDLDDTPLRAAQRRAYRRRWKGYRTTRSFAEIQARRTGATAHRQSGQAGRTGNPDRQPRDDWRRQARRRCSLPGRCRRSAGIARGCSRIERVVLVHRLREVVAQVGLHAL